MAISQFKHLKRSRFLQRFPRPRLATLVMLGVVAVSGLMVTAWFAGEDQITNIFAQLQRLQESPPMWLAVPMVSVEYLLAWTVILFLLVLGITRISPQPRPWSRFLVVVILLGLTLNYLQWRSLTTLNLSDPLNGTFSLALLLLELLVLLSNIIQLCLLLGVREDRQQEANNYAVAVQEGRFQPAVDILIPTYSEPEFILQRTVMGCQALDYEPKRIYLLDDTRRPQVQALAAELGCEYITRPDNRHAKAGNLNHAIARTTGELIAVFDADFVPTSNFLTRTVGFFQDPKVALVQTPQSFYNVDPITRNLGLENQLTPDEEVFYRHVQPIKDAVGSVTCSGTSFLVRREPLEADGGFVTDSLSEDYFTGVRLSARGYRLVYLNEKLSAGLAAENMAAYALQRLRWARGTLQAFFIQANPLTIAGLGLWQRLAHFEGLLVWFTNLSRVYFLLIPLAYSFLGVIPLRATFKEVMFFFVPYYLVQLTTFSWLNRRSRSVFVSEVYSLVLAFPVTITVIQTLLDPFARGFKVTPKGTARDRLEFNWSLAWPLLLLFVATAFSLCLNLGHCMIKAGWQLTVPQEVAAQVKGIGLGWPWSGYNLVMIGLALLILLDVPKPDMHEWFDLRRTVKLQVGQQVVWGCTTMISEAGAEVELTQLPLPLPVTDLPVSLEILETGLILTGQIGYLDRGHSDRFATVRVLFTSLSLSQQRSLVEMLFCRPGQWKHQETQGELQSLWLLLRSLLRPRALSYKNSQIRAMAVSKV